MVTQSKTADEIQVQELMARLEHAINNQDMDTLKTCYAPDILAFDMLPPLQYKGADAVIALYRQCFSHPGSAGVSYRLVELKLQADDQIAFCSALSNASGQKPSGEKFSNWFRGTYCLRKIDGTWLIAHEHTSVPADMETGLAMQDLQPA